MNTLHTKKSDRYVVMSAARGLDVLDVLAAHGVPMSATEVANAVGLPRPTVFRLLATLQQRNWIFKEKQTYRLGFKCFQLGAKAGAGIEIRTHALPYLVELRDKSGVNAQIAKLEDWQVVYLERVLARELGVETPSRAGAILPAHCTALGKVLLAHRNLEDVARWARVSGLPRYTDHTITEIPQLISELLTIRERGYATELGEREEHMVCLAAPVRDFSGEVIASLSISGPRERMQASLDTGDFVPLITHAANDISTELGWVENSSRIARADFDRMAK